MWTTSQPHQFERYGQPRIPQWLRNRGSARLKVPSSAGPCNGRQRANRECTRWLTAHHATRSPGQRASTTAAFPAANIRWCSTKLNLLTNRQPIRDNKEKEAARTATNWKGRTFRRANTCSSARSTGQLDRSAAGQTFPSRGRSQTATHGTRPIIRSK
jgi:hypothetical protein